MCIATPETVLSIEESATGPVGTILHAGRVISGDTILFFRGNARRVIEETEARKIRAALSALADVMDGKASPDDIEAGFADLIDHPGQLPEHLRKELEDKHARR